MFKKPIALSFLILGSLPKVLGISELGGYMSYKHDTLNKWDVFIHVYRDCRGVGLGAGGTTDLTVNFLNKSGASIGTQYATISRIQIQDISINQQGRKSPCSPQNTYATGIGTELHIYKASIDFDKSPYSTSFTNSNLYSIRFQYYKTYISSGNTLEFYLESELKVRTNSGNLIDSKNNSPEALMHQSPFHCINTGRYLPFTMQDSIDFDSLKYSLIQDKINASTTYPYSSPFSYQFPLTPYCVPPTTIKCSYNTKTNPPRGFYFDTNSAMCIFTPTKADEVSPLAIKIAEYRLIDGNIIEIGSINFKFTFFMSDQCGYNYIPSISAPNSAVFAIDKVNKISLTSSDNPFTPYQTADTTDIFIPNAPLGSTYKRATPFNKYDEGVFEWKPDEEWFGKQLQLICAVKDRPSGDHPAYVTKTVLITFRGQYSDYTLYTFLDKNNNGKKDSSEPILPNVTLGIKLSNGKSSYKTSDPNGAIKIPVFSGNKVVKTLVGSKWFNTIGFDTLKFYGKDTTFTQYLPLHSFPFIQGQLYYDINADCAKNGADFNAGGLRVFSDNSAVMSDSIGKFTIYLDTNITSINYYSKSYTDSCKNKLKYINIKLPLDTFLNAGDISIKPYFDLETGFGVGQIRRGSKFNYSISIFNNSAGNLKKYTDTNYPKLTLEYNKKLIQPTANQTNYIDSANKRITWKMADIKAHSTYTFNGSFYVHPDSLVTGDLLQFRVTIDSTFNDSNLANNAVYFKGRILGPHDPNDKTICSQDSLTPTDNAQYRIDFQNYGTDTAFQVIVIDTLSPLFDPSSLTILESSAPYNYELRGGILSVKFADIKLTDTVTSMPNSKGFFTFQVKPKSISGPTTIQNQASIYFDFEKPVPTPITQLHVIANSQIKSLKPFYCIYDSLRTTYRVNIMQGNSNCAIQLIDVKTQLPVATLDSFTNTPKELWQKRNIHIPKSVKSGYYQLLLSNNLILYPGFNETSDSFYIQNPLPAWSYNTNFCENEILIATIHKGHNGDIYLNGNKLKQTADTARATFVPNASKLSAYATTVEGCQWKDSTIIVTYPLPKTNVNAPAFTCYQSAFSISLPANLHTVYNNDSLIYSNTIDTVLNITPKSGDISLNIIETSSHSCKDSIKITIRQQPKITFKAFTPPIACSYDSIKVSLYGNYNFELYQDNKVVKQNSKPGNYHIYPNSQKPILAVATDSLNCSMLDSIPFPTKEKQYPIISTNKATICKNDSIEISFKGLPKADVYFNQNSIFSISNGSSKKWATVGNNDFALFAAGKSDSGCSFSSDTLRIKVITENINLNIHTSKTEICEYDSLELFITGMPKANIYLNQNFQFTLIENTKKYIANQTRKYTLIASQISDTGCLYESPAIEINVFAAPAKPVIYRRNDTLISSNAIHPTWLFENALISNHDTFNFIIPDNDGNYSVKSTNENGCYSISEPYKVTFASTSHNKISDLIVYPNPIYEQINIRANNTISRVVVYSASGVEIRAVETIAQKTITIQSQDLIPGQYYLRVVFQNQTEKSIRIQKY